MRLDPDRIEVVDDDMAAVLRQKTGAERLKIANDLFVFARQLLLASLRADHPDWTDEQVTQEASRRLLHQTS